MARVERARPWLGTLTAIRASGADEACVTDAVEQAFAVIGHIHRRMSFQSADSDLSIIGRLKGGEQAILDPATSDCLERALAFAADSDGAFEPVLPGNGASWRDMRLDGPRVWIKRPLRIDLSGIAKGYAVDRACDVLLGAGLSSAIVNAGGDLRTFGIGEAVKLTPYAAAPPAAILIKDGALASSDVAGSSAEYGTCRHYDGRTDAPSPPTFVSVAAPRCVDADALTKVVLAMDDDAETLLHRHRAIAYVHSPGEEWRTIGREA